MIYSTLKTDPLPSIVKSKGAAIRTAALVASLAGLILPAITSSAMGLTQSANMLQLASWFIIVPIAIGVSVVMPGIASQFSRLADIVAAIIIVAVLAYAGSVVFDAWNQVSQIAGQATGMLRNMPVACPAIWETWFQASKTTEPA